MKTINGDLILKEDTVFNESIEVIGNIICEEGIWNIKARDIDAWNIKARNIDAWDIKARNIEAENIEAEDISYYAVCYARKSFVCKSIEGKRKNSKHFCLDGELEIRSGTVEDAESKSHKEVK